MDSTKIVTNDSPKGDWMETRRGSLQAYSSERTLHFDDETRPPAEGDLHGVGVALEEKIRDGGMSTVLRGKQLSLRRNVAVKTSQSDAECARLLSEAYVIGALEHPNIVPIHDLLMDPQGRPQLVLKHVEGRSWLDILDSGEAVAEFGSDPVERALRIGIEVSLALSYAHERGVVHRDIKPANIMVGNFGEVYLLDWGLAAAFAYDPRTAELPRLPERELVGTPAYMAPEQYRGNREEIGPWTDVYLLAGTLLHALTGQPPWVRNAQGERERTQLPATTSPGLVELFAKAMATRPVERFQSAEAFRKALESYRQQRGSRALSLKARQTAEAATAASRVGNEEAAERAATEAEVLFRAALAEWPDNPVAKRDRQAFMQWRVEHTLARGETPVAARLVAAWAEAPKALRTRVEQSVEESRRDSIRVSRMKTDNDVAFGAKTRIQLIMILGPPWILTWALLAYLQSIPITMGATLITLVIHLFLVAVRRETLLANRINATLVGVVGCALVATCLLLWAVHLHDETMLSAAPMLMLIYGMTAAFIGLTVEPVALALAVLWAVLMVVALMVPVHGLWILVGGTLISTASALIANWRDSQRKVKRRRRG
ncbi:MAG: serine/threonine-protein kinase [Myxococcota bacterium]